MLTAAVQMLFAGWQLCSIFGGRDSSGLASMKWHMPSRQSYHTSLVLYVKTEDTTQWRNKRLQIGGFLPNCSWTSSN